MLEEMAVHKQLEAQGRRLVHLALVEHELLGLMAAAAVTTAAVLVLETTAVVEVLPISAVSVTGRLSQEIHRCQILLEEQI
jgi:hypothetical protein